MFKNGLIVLAILATCHYQSTEGFSLTRYGNLGKYVELAQALKYGNDCAWEAEEYRQNFTREKLMASGVPTMNMIMELANTMVERDYKLCSAAELFICDKESQKCVCGDPGFESLMGVNRSLYVLEGTNKCRWNTNTYCVSSEHLRSQRQLGFTVDSECKSGSTCKIGEGDACSIQSMMRHLLQNHGMMILFSPRRITEEIMSGRVCTCRADQAEEVEDSAENEISNSWDAEPARRKRSVSSSESSESQEAVRGKRSVSSSESSESQEAVRGKRSVSSSESSESQEAVRGKRSVSSSESSESQEAVRGKRSVSSSESSESQEAVRGKRSVSSSESSESQEAVRGKRSVSSSESSESQEAVRGKRSVSSSESSESQEAVRGKRSVSSSESSESQEAVRGKRSVSSSESSESQEAVRGKRSVSSSESSESQEAVRGKRSVSSSESSESVEFVRRKRSIAEEVGASMLASYVTGPTITV